MKNIEVLIKEIKEAEKARGEVLPMLPIVNMYFETDYRIFHNRMRDYLWFNDEHDIKYNSTNKIKLFR